MYRSGHERSLSPSKLLRREYVAVLLESRKMKNLVKAKYRNAFTVYNGDHPASSVGKKFTIFDKYLVTWSATNNHFHKTVVFGLIHI